MRKDTVDYSLYLVTDSRPEILGDRDICDVVEAALKGGVTCVQFREKTSDTGELVRVARKLHAITRRYGVPLLINDRVDVALAVGCEGVHIGQDDMVYSDARRLLGQDAIIGVSANNISEALAATSSGADYLGIGAIYATPTKTNTKDILGATGVQRLLVDLSNAGMSIPAVGIGGINLDNVADVMLGSRSDETGLDGVAVVSAIMAAQDAEAASRELLGVIQLSQKPETTSRQVQHADGKDEEDLPSKYRHDTTYQEEHVKSILEEVHKAKPISHNMTNLVVQNFAANVALAVGASPIMSNNGEEAADLARLNGALLLNMGTVTPDSLNNYIKALKAYNQASRPVVFDPVGVGATAVRRSAAKTILDSGKLVVVKGNEGEIRTIAALADGAASVEQQRGVDSSSTLSVQQKVDLVTSLSARLKSVVVLTGKTDFISDGDRTYALDNGHELLGQVTGTGCVLGTTLSAMVAAHPHDTLAAVFSGVCLFNVAAERAARRNAVQGPGTFVPAFIDELAKIREDAAQGEYRWLQDIKAYRCM